MESAANWKLSLDELKSKRDLHPHVHSKKKVRHFYKRQNEIIDNLIAWNERIENGGTMEDDVDNKLSIRLLIYASFAANIVLVIIKIAAAVMSGSLAVIASTIDSFLDVLSGAIIFTAARLAKKRDPMQYPQGKTRFEPLSVVIFSSVMGMAGLQIIIQSIQDIMQRAGKKIDPITIDTQTWVILGVVIATKLVLFLACRGLRKESVSLDALAQDHFNDVLSNSLSVLAVGLASTYPKVWFLDPGFAILFALFIMVVWSNTGKEQIQHLAGITADNEFLNQITFLTYNHHKSIVKVDTVRAYHMGSRLLVEVDIVLPEDMPLKLTHDIGESLQMAIEKLDNVERAYVHMDYEWTHAPEHKVIKGL